MGRALLLGLAAAACAPDPPGPPPNQIVVVIDTLRADAVTPAGAPFLAGLAERSVTAGQARATSSWTRPSAGTIWTGLYPSTHGAVGRRDMLLPGPATLPEMLRGAGYASCTAFVTNPNVASAYGFARGWDDYFELYERRDAGFVGQEELITPASVVIDQVAGWLEDAPAEPWLLLVFLIDPHAPYEGGLVPTLPGPGLRAAYAADVRATDAQVGRLWDEVAAAGLADRTAWIVAADHGEEFGEHALWGHGQSLYGTAVDIPLLVSAPGEQPRRLAAAASLIDLVPTCRDLAGLAPDPSLPGRSLLGGAADSEERGLLTELDLEAWTSHDRFRSLSLERGGFKAVWYPDLRRPGGRPAVELFDLAADPGEARNLASEPAHSGRVQAMVDVLRAHRDSAANRIGAGPASPAMLQTLEALGYGAEEQD